MRRDNNGEWDAYAYSPAPPPTSPAGWWDSFDFEGVLRGTSYKIKNVAGCRPALVWRDDETHVAFVTKKVPSSPAAFAAWVDDVTDCQE